MRHMNSLVSSFAKANIFLKTALAFGMVLNASAAFAATCTWTGVVDGNWSNNSNWNVGGGGCSNGPTSGRSDDLVFPDSAPNKTLTHNRSALSSVNSITINGCFYDMTGTLPLDITGAVPITVNCNVTTGAVNTINFQDVSLTNVGAKEMHLLRKSGFIWVLQLKKCTGMAA
jgi:hypothetical protein